MDLKLLARVLRADNTDSEIDFAALDFTPLVGVLRQGLS
jgi:hypothetical protein